MARNYLQGKFTPKHPEKYAGDPTNIIFRSSWERKCAIFFDNNPNIIKWASEEIIIPYYDPATGRNRRYFPDFAVVAKTTSGVIERILVEVKPKAQTRPPVKTTKITKRYITEVATYATNQAKWQAAESWVRQHGFDRFQILTEDQL